MGTQLGGSVGQSSNQGQLGNQNPGAFAPVGQGSGPTALGEHNTASQNVIPTATVDADLHQDQSSHQTAYGGDATGGDISNVASGNVGIDFKP